MAFTVTINGESRELAMPEDSATLAAVLAELGLKSDRIAVELNGGLASRKHWPELRVHDRDRLEIVHFVGGGR